MATIILCSYGLTTLGMAGCYYAASSNMQFEEFLTRHGLLGSTAPTHLQALLCTRGSMLRARPLQLTRSKTAGILRGKAPSLAG